MRLAWIPLFVASALLGAAACGSSGASSSNDADASTQDGGPGADGSTAPDGGGGGDPKLPGDPPSGGAASVAVTINGRQVTFNGVAGWTKVNSDAGTIVGFQTNAHDSKEWTFVMGVFGNAPGTYSCVGQTRTSGLSLTNQIKSDGGYEPNGIEYGGTDTTEMCSITLTSYGSNKGDHVTGTFTAQLGLSHGFDQTSVTMITLTDGKFDLVQFADTPP